MEDIHVIKRDGSRERFDANKINLALVKASEGLDDQIGIEPGNAQLPGINQAKITTRSHEERFSDSLT